jgi:AraC-like DNA-binding protein/mannose-6-phosphate isomerase-like protein (cupin superfamily)
MVAINMNVYYESNLQRSIYNSALFPCWFDVTRYYSLTYPSRSMDLHAHTEIEIMYATRGKCVVPVKNGSVSLREGDYIFIDSLVPHGLVVESSSPCHILNIEASLISKHSLVNLDILAREEAFRSLRESRSPFAKLRDDGVLQNSIVNLQSLLNRRASLMEVDFQLSLIFLEIGHHFFNNQRKKRKSINTYIKSALDYISSNFDDELTIDTIAAAVGISKAHLQRSFRLSEGCTIVEAINRLRINKAKVLLESGNIPIVEIANEVGFNSRQYFSTLFTRSTGVTPAEYRKHQRGNMASGFGDADMGVKIE